MEDEKQRYCKTCGSSLNDGMVFCSECGSRVILSDEEPRSIIKEDESSDNTNDQSSSYQDVVNDQQTKDSTSSLELLGYGLLSVFFPVVGIVLFIIFFKEHSTRTKVLGIISIPAFIFHVSALILVCLQVAMIVGFVAY